MGIHCPLSLELQPSPSVGDRRLTEVAEITTKLRVILLVLAVLHLAGIGDPVERGTPIQLDDAGCLVGVGVRVAQRADAVFQLLRTLLMRVGSHRDNLPIDCEKGAYRESTTRAWRMRSEQNTFVRPAARRRRAGAELGITACITACSTYTEPCREGERKQPWGPTRQKTRTRNAPWWAQRKTERHGPSGCRPSRTPGWTRWSSALMSRSARRCGSGWRRKKRSPRC